MQVFRPVISHELLIWGLALVIHGKGLKMFLVEGTKIKIERTVEFVSFK